MSAAIQRCRVCGCTEREPCNPPCAWFDESLCTSCALVVEAIVSWAEGAHRINRTALWREVDERTETILRCGHCGATVNLATLTEDNPHVCAEEPGRVK
jgi:hypothetical protein